MKTAIIIDSTAYASPEIVNHPDVYVLELSTTFADGTVIPDSSDVEVQERFYTKLKNENNLPTTSQPSPGKYVKIVEDIIKKGYEQLLCIHLSQTFSGTYQTANMIVDAYADQIDAHVIDSKGVSEVIGAIVEQALDMLETELEFSEICEKLEWVAKNSTIYLTVSDLYNLEKGGRVNMTTARIGSLLKVRPLLYVNEQGGVQVLDKIRTDKKVNRRLAQIAKEDDEKFPKGIMLRFAHAVDEERVNETIQVVHEAVPHLEYKVGTLGPVIGTHTGIGTVGMGTIPIADY